MKLFHVSGQITLIRASDGTKQSVPSGTDVVLIDDVGSRREKKAASPPAHEPVLYGEEVWYAPKGSLVSLVAYAAHGF